MQAALHTSWEQRLRSWYILFFQLPWLPERLLGLNRAAGLARLLKASSHPGCFSTEELERYREAWLQPGAIQGMLAWYRAAFRFARQTFLERRVAAPTLILWGAADAALSLAMARTSLEWCEDGQLVEFPSASHWVQHDEPEAVNQHLLQFLSTSR